MWLHNPASLFDFPVFMVLNAFQVWHCFLQAAEGFSRKAAQAYNSDSLSDGGEPSPEEHADPATAARQQLEDHCNAVLSR